MFPKPNKSSSINSWHLELKSSLFDIQHDEDNLSAIDSFSSKNTELNQLIIDPTGKIPIINRMIQEGEINEDDGRKILALLSSPNSNSKFLNLILLGYISSVEAYLRKLFRELVNIDPFSKEACENLPLNFGATYYQDQKMYPESLMSNSTFISSKNIREECKRILGLKSLKPNTDSLQEAFTEFDSICQLRHCIVHRFGNIGVKNLISLKLHTEDFKDCIEKPIILNFSAIQKVSKTTVNLVRELNHTLWQAIMERLRDSDPSCWTWDLRTDKKEFRKYLKIFHDSSMGDIETRLTQIYNEYKKTK